MELREKEWDMAARVRERALADTRERVNVLLKELGNATAEIRARDARIADLQIQLEDHRRHLVTVVSRAVSKSRATASKSQSRIRAKPKGRTYPGTKRLTVNRKPVNSKTKSQRKRP
jgi:Tfp pilus assembly protein FimV